MGIAHRNKTTGQSYPKPNSRVHRFILRYTTRCIKTEEAQAQLKTKVSTNAAYNIFADRYRVSKCGVGAVKQRTTRSYRVVTQCSNPSMGGVVAHGQERCK